MRAQKSAKNIIVALISNALNIVLGVVVQSIFLKTLGEEYLGLNTVLTSILSMLSIAELGLGSAIIYNMYKPIANKDKEKIKAFHDYVINMLSYDTSLNIEENGSNKAYGALVNKKAVCSGYSDLMAIFLDRLGIKNYKIIYG